MIKETNEQVFSSILPHGIATLPSLALLYLFILKKIFVSCILFDSIIIFNCLIMVSFIFIVKKQNICDLIGRNIMHISNIFICYSANINGMWNGKKLRIYTKHLNVY